MIYVFQTSYFARLGCLWKMAERTIQKKNNRRINFLGKGMEIRLGCSTFRPPWTELNVDALSDCLSGRNWAPLRIGVSLVTGKLNVEITFSNGTWNLALFQCAFWQGLTIHKSVNLQYIMLGCLDDGTNESLTKSLMFQVLCFYILFIDLGHSKLFIFIFVIL